MNVAPVDWLILGALFVALLALAVWINSQCRSVADYLVSGRKVRLWLGMGAGIAGEIGLVSIVAMCEQGYMRGFGFVLIGLMSMCVMVPLFGVFGFGIERFRADQSNVGTAVHRDAIQLASPDLDGIREFGGRRTADVYLSDRGCRLCPGPDPRARARPRGWRLDSQRLDGDGRPLGLRDVLHVFRGLCHVGGRQLRANDHHHGGHLLAVGVPGGRLRSAKLLDDVGANERPRARSTRLSKVKTPTPSSGLLGCWS